MRGRGEKQGRREEGMRGRGGKEKNNDGRGFTLIEVVVSITLLFMVVAAVFYFYSNLMDNQGKFKEKYALLRISREFVDSFVFSSDRAEAMQKGGRIIVEGFILRWRVSPVEKKREVLYSSGMPPMAQLHRVHLQIFKKQGGKQLLELKFLANIIFPPGEG